MARPVLRVVRTPQPGHGAALTASVLPTALVAASAPIATSNDVFKKTTTFGVRRDDWQNEAWDLFDLVGELGSYVRWRARSCSRVKLVASEVDPATGQPTGSITEGNDEGRKVADIVHSIAGGPLGQAEFIEQAVTILSVPGEFYTAILITDEGERWLALSKQQIKASQKVRDGITIVLPEGGEHEFTPANGDGMFRVWNPHPKMPTQATSPVQANLSPLREIARTTAKMENADHSRMRNNGLLIIPLEASLPSTQAPTAANKPGGSTDTSAQQPGVAQTLQKMIMDANEASFKNPQGPAAEIPTVIGAPAEHVDKIKHVTFGKDVADIEIKKRDSAMLRFARGIDMEPDQLLGLGDTNHWNGHLLADQDVNLHVSPVMKLVCQAFWRNVIRPMLVKIDIDPAKYALTIDTSDLTIDPDKSDDVEAAYEAGTITIPAYLKGRGIDPDSAQDLTTREGQLAFATMAVTKDPTLLPTYAPLFGGLLADVKFAPPALPGAPADDHGDPPVEVPVDGSPPGTEGQAPRKPVTAAIADGVAMVVDSYETRALELAGKRRVKTYDHDQRARLAARPAHEWHRSLPPVAASDVGRLIAGYDSGLDDLAGKYGFDADLVRAQVVAQVRRRLMSQVVDA